MLENNDSMIDFLSRYLKAKPTKMSQEEVEVNQGQDSIEVKVVENEIEALRQPLSKDEEEYNSVTNLIQNGASTSQRK